MGFWMLCHFATKGTAMKQWMTALCAVSLAFGVSVSVMAQSVGNYQTDRHNLVFSVGPKVGYFNTYVVKAWVKPRDEADGEPDFVLGDGKTDEGLAGDGMCSREIYAFPKAGAETTFEIFHPDSNCQIEEHPREAVGQLILDSSSFKGRWWVYKR